QLLQRSESLFVNVVRVAFLGEADALDAEKHHRILVRRDGGVGHDEADRGLVGVVLRKSNADAKAAWHSPSLKVSDQSFLRRIWYTGCRAETRECPVSPHHAGMSSTAPGSSAVSSSTCPGASCFIRMASSIRSSPHPMSPAFHSSIVILDRHSHSTVIFNGRC